MDCENEHEQMNMYKYVQITYASGMHKCNAQVECASELRNELWDMHNLVEQAGDMVWRVVEGTTPQCTQHQCLAFVDGCYRQQSFNDSM